MSAPSLEPMEAREHGRPNPAAGSQVMSDQAEAPDEHHPPRSLDDVLINREKLTSGHRAGQKKGPLPTLREWKWELLACIFSLACMAAIVAILSTFQGKALQDWNLPGGILPNSVVSIFATLSKSAMLYVLGEGISHLKWIYFQQRGHRVLHMQTFDDASRGPWGSLILIRRIRWRASLAAGGALLVILALAIDPFAQQVLSYPPKKIGDPRSNASLPLAREYKNEHHHSTTGVTGPVTKSDKYFYAFSDALLQGVYAPSLEVKPTCTSGNCTWPAYETLAVCSKCTDVSSQLVRECRTSHKVVGCSVPPLNVCDWQSNQKCDYTFPDGAVIEAGTHGYAETSGDPLVNGQMLHVDGTQLNMTCHAGGSFVPTDQKIYDGPLAKLRGLRFPSKTGNWTLPPAEGFECEFRWCVETYADTTVENGHLHDIPTKTQDLVLWTCETTADPDDPTLPTYCPGFLPDQVPAVLRGPQPIATTENYKTYLHPEILKNPNVWLIDFLDYGNLQYDMSQLLNTSYGHGNNSYFASSIARANGGNVSQTMANIARALTLHIRQGPQSTLHVGTTHIYQTYIAVNWNWLILPFALVLLSTGFLATCMIFQMDHSQSPWKSSSLAVLFHGLSERPHADNDLGSDEGMDKEAREIFVHLDEDSEGVVSLLRR